MTADVEYATVTTNLDSVCPRPDCGGRVIIWAHTRRGLDISCLLCGRNCTCEYYTGHPCELHD